MGCVCPGACLSGTVGSMLRGKERGGEARAGRGGEGWEGGRLGNLSRLRDAVPCVGEEAGHREKALPRASRL